jgi:glutathione S-transferase
MRLETWLRMTESPHEVTFMDLVNVPPPKGKVPYVNDAGKLMGDSTFIIKHLVRTRGVDPDAELSAADRAVSWALQRMLMENTYWLVVHDRYRAEAGWQVYRRLVMGMLAPGAPEEQQAPIAEEFRRGILAQYNGHGIGRHTEAEVDEIGADDLAALSDFLGNKPFFFGEKPTTTDATAYACVANLIEVPLDTPTARFGRSRRNLVDFCRRMHLRFFPDIPREDAAPST